jgi:putative hydrolase of the HAD superfamily
VYIPFHVTWQLEHAEHFEHPRMTQISRFSQLLECL